MTPFCEPLSAGPLPGPHLGPHLGSPIAAAWPAAAPLRRRPAAAGLATALARAFLGPSRRRLQNIEDIDPGILADLGLGGLAGGSRLPAGERARRQADMAREFASRGRPAGR